MTQNILDLRKPDIIDLKAGVVVESFEIPQIPEAREDEKPEQILEEELGKNDSDKISWEAQEYGVRDRTTGWYLGILAVAVALITVGILAKSYFFVIFVVFAFGMMFFYSKRESRKTLFIIAEDGIYLGRRFYQYGYFKSFWILDKIKPGELVLETPNIMNHYLNIPLPEVDPEKIRDFVSRFIPEKEYNEGFMDALARRLGF